MSKDLTLEVLKKRVSPEIFHQLCVELETCPECLTQSLIYTQDDAREITCKSCGLVIGQQLLRSHSLPGHGSDTHYSDTCSLSFDKGLGSHLSKYQLYSVLNHAPAKRKDLGIRAIRIRNATKTEVPQIEKMLNYGSLLCKRYGLNRKGDERSILFAETLGRVIRHAGAFSLALSRRSIYSKKLAYACFVWCFERLCEDGHRLRQELDIDNAAYNWLSWLMVNFPLLPLKLEFYHQEARSKLSKVKIEEIESGLAKLPDVSN